MVSTENIQSAFLTEVKKRLPPNLSFADELAEILKISRDSSYRRIRGETILSLDEIKVICNHYKVSLDTLLSPSSTSVTFQFRAIGFENYTFFDWLKSIMSNLEMIHNLPDKQIFYSAKDVPVFQYFNSPGLAAFKIYFWVKTFIGSDYQQDKFRFDLIQNELLSIAKKIWEKYMNIPSTEIWSEETIQITLRQIEFHYECGFFQNKQDIHKIIDEYSEMIKKIQENAASGTKGMDSVPFKLYKNDILIADNTILFKMGDKSVTFIPHNTFEILTTAQDSFCKQTEKHINALMNKAILISTTGEKDRNRFFNSIDAKIEELRAKIR